MFRAFFGFFFNRFTLVLCGLILLSLVIWFIGPLVYIKPYQPLESEGLRWAIIGLIFGVWFLRLFVQWWRRKGFNAKFANAMLKFTAPGETTAAAPGVGAEEVAELEKRFKDAMGVLSKTKFAQTEGGLFGRWSKRYLYQLPWYVIIGSPGSGKTTALVNSGLNFPLAAQFGKGAIRGIGGTSNCDWWFTDEAVLLDTAGRYTTQESNQEQDKAAWSGFLNLLKRFRGRQPVNGVLVALSVEELLNPDPVQRDHLAQTIGLRLAELCDELAVKFPVYVLVTKADLLSGFNEFFGNMTRDQRAQVWGFTLPLDEDKQSTLDPLGRFDEEFGDLAQQINRLLPERLLAEPDLARRGQIYALPQQFVGLREALKTTLVSIFAASKFKEKPILRGAYLTSGTQEGTPLDRVMTGLVRRFGSPKLNAAPAAAAGGAGKSFFIETLFKGVIFNEAGLTGRNATKERQLRLIQAGGLIAIVTVLCGLVVAWAVSYGHNSRYLEEVQTKVNSIKTALDEAKRLDPDDLSVLLPLMDATENIAKSEQYRGDSPPLSWRMGLLQVPMVETVSNATYLRLLEDAWVPYLSKQLHASLKSVDGSQIEASYEGLKVYLMLRDPDHFDAKLFKAWLLNDWGQTLPVALQQTGILDRLSHHLDRLTDNRVVVSSTPIDNALVAEVRQRLTQMSPAQRAYSRLKQLLQTSDGLPPDFTLVRAAGPEAPQMFSRKSGKPLTEGVPGIFTYDGYYGSFSHELPKVTTLLSKEDAWVLGQTVQKGNLLNEVMTGQLANEVKRLYLMEYAKRWEDFLADVRPVRSGTLEQVGEQARLYSAANSGVELFVRAVGNEVTLSRRPSATTGASGSSWLGDKMNKIKEEQMQLSRLTGKKIDVGGLANSGTLEADIVDFRFREYRRLAGTGSGPSPMTTSLQVMNEAAAVIASARQAVKAGGAVPPGLSAALERVRGEAKRLPPPLNAMYEEVAANTSQLVGRDVRSAVGGNLSGSVGTFCQQVITGRYPFTRSATRDVTLDDFAKVFSVGGMMDDFFRSTLQPMVDISTNPWSFKRGIDGAPAGGSTALAAFQRAATIRDVFFRASGSGTGMRLDVKPLEMDASITQLVLDVGGDSLRYQHGPQTPKTFTWPTGRGVNQIRLQITITNGENSGFTTEGPWAMHRLFDKAQITPGNAPEKFFATFSVDGRPIKFEVTASSALNPFRLRAIEEFQCPRDL